jgi:tetratricopeptide (TPR) repeat protein
VRILIGRCALALLILEIAIPFANAQEKTKPVSDKELIALVAGTSLSETVVHEIESRGLAFRPSDQYRALLTEAGGDTRVLAALRNAKTIGGAANDGNDTSGQLLQHLSTAGMLIRKKQYEEAAKELTAALQSEGGPEAGYVMGELLHGQQRWPEAAAVYAEVLRQSPDFTEAHTMLSNILHHLGDAEGALREAKLALAEFPDNAEAHRNAGNALVDLQKYTVAEQELREALRVKPDYAGVRYDLGILFDNTRKWDQSVAEYKKSIALDPSDERVHYNLGIVYSKEGDSDSAIREFREAKRLNPKMSWARQNLANELVRRNMNAEAVAEYRELEAIEPDSVFCHNCLGTALFRTWDFQGAEKEFRRAIELDPSNPSPHLGLGGIFEQQKDYDAALEEFRRAQHLDDSSADAHRDLARVLLAKKDLSGAIVELKYAENLAPSSWTTHDLLGQGLEASGNLLTAIAEFKQAVAIDPKQVQARLDLAAAFEKNMDWAAALNQFHQAALADSSAGVQNQYKMAQDRLNSHIASIAPSGKPPEAATQKPSPRATNSDAGISGQVDMDIQEGFNAMLAGRSAESEAKYKDAVELAGKLQPHDDRLVTSLIRLADLYGRENNFAEKESALQRAFRESVDLHGAESPLTTESLWALGADALSKSDYKSALDFYSRAVDVNKKTFGENNSKVADSLTFLAGVYVGQGSYDKAEPYLLRAVQIDESLFGRDGFGLDAIPLWNLCDLYDKWNKPEKAEPCFHEILALREKRYGMNSPFLLPTLRSEAKVLHQLGREGKATQVEQQMQSIRAATAQSEPVATAPHP